MSSMGPEHPYRCKSGSECYGFSPISGATLRVMSVVFRGNKRPSGMITPVVAAASWLDIPVRWRYLVFSYI